MNEDKSDLGQLLQISLPLSDTSNWKRLIEEIVPGSIVIQGGNVSISQDVKNFVERVKNICDELSISISRRPLIGITHEGGWISRIHDIANSPGHMALAATGSLNYTYSAYRAMGQELSRLGIDWNLAPVVDINTSPVNPIIGVRSFGDDAKDVAENSISAYNGLKDAGLIACAKHFPGHGASVRDSHLEMPTVDKSLNELMKSDLVPYRELIANGIDSIMISHISYPKLEKGSNAIPASLSEKIINKLLRTKMGFDGLVITDSLSMSAVADNFSMETATIMSVQAGVDILECAEPNKYINIFQALQNSVMSGKISRNRINQSLNRFKALRNVSLNRKASSLKWSNEVLWNIASASANAAITVLREGKMNNEAIRKTRYINSVFFTRNRLLEVESPKLLKSPVQEIINSWGMKSRFNLVFPRNMSEKQIDENVNLVISKKREGDFLLVFMNDSAAYDKTDMKVPPQVTFLRRLLPEFNDRLAVIGTGTPYEVHMLPEQVTYISAFSFVPTSLSASIGVILGALPARGNLPVKI